MLLKVKYKSVIVDLGNHLTPTQVQNPPISLKWTAEQGALYTLIMTGTHSLTFFYYKKSNSKMLNHLYIFERS